MTWMIINTRISFWQHLNKNKINFSSYLKYQTRLVPLARDNKPMAKWDPPCVAA